MRKVLIVDDSNMIRMMHKKALEKKGFQTIEAEDGMKALDILLKDLHSIEAIILDQEMPVMSGIELLKYIKADKDMKNIPVIFVSTLTDEEFIKSVLALGVYDYLVKPIESEIFCLKVKNAVNFYLQELELKTINSFVIKRNEELEGVVAERTKELNQMLYSLLNALENANYYSDNDTGMHIQRVSEYSYLISRKYGLDEETCKGIKTFAPIHDIGKIGIPDSILKKPGKLTPEEFEVMKGHVDIGYNMIKDAPLPLIAKNIVRYHHEKWNGRGYMAGLKGEEIPIEAQIVSISDVFDALISKRVYKEAFDIMTVVKIIMEERGESFNPRLVDIVLEDINELEAISKRLL